MKGLSSINRYILLTYRDNYADEFDVFGVDAVMMNETEYQKFMTNLERSKEELTGEYELYFGTNEWITYEDVTDFLQRVSVKEISVEKFNTIVDLGLDELGVHIMLRLKNLFGNLK